MCIKKQLKNADPFQKIKSTLGQGFQLKKELDGWLYNRSNIVLYTSSPTIQTEGVGVSHPIVKRLAPGTSVLVLDPNFLPDANEKVKSIGQSLSFFKNTTTKDSETHSKKLYK